MAASLLTMKPSQQLRDEVDLLKVVYYRNKNQHRNQVWWKYFSIFLRRASQLARSNKADPATAKFLDRKLIPKLWRALHTALAQGAFLTITFTAMAGVARIAELIQPAVPVHQTQHKLRSELEVQMEDIGEEITEDNLVGNDDSMPNIQSAALAVDSRDDYTGGGEVFSEKSGKHSKKTRKEKKLTRKPSQIDAIDTIFGTPPGGAIHAKDRKKSKKSSKKKKVDAIDAIFG